LTLDALESSFIVFRTPIQQASAEKNYPKGNRVATIDGPWSITFEENRGGPKKPIITDTLFDWIESENPQIKYFSGNAIYQTTFQLDKLPENPTYIDLGKVMVMAKIRVNGQEAGGVWTSPYQVNVTHLLKEGINKLEVEVVNCWRNRMIGELSMPEKERFTFHSASTVKKDSPMQSSGLLGPVQLISYPYDMK